VLVLSSHYKEPDNRDKLRALAGLGCDLVVATPGGHAATDGQLRLVPVPVSRTRGDPADVKWHPGALRRLMSEQRPDLVQVEEAPESLLASSVAGIAERLHLPVALFSSSGPRHDLGLLERRRARRVLERVAGVIGGNKLVAEAMAAAGASDALVDAIPQSGIQLPPPAERPEPAELAIGFVGRLVPERGIDRLIEALSQTYGKWTLTVLGTGPEQEAAEELVQRFGLASRVRWLGGTRRDALDQLWREINCLVIPTREVPGAEPHSPILLDAMSHGIVAVVSAAGALPELVGDTGIVFRGGENLIEILQRLVADPGRTALMGFRARQRVLEHYSVAAVAARTYQFWQALVAERKATARAS
jgi:glycosyltransferase involved in cell wall biosynthesis